MRLEELSKDQIKMLKQRYLIATDYSVMWAKLEKADEFVSDEDIRTFYGSTYEFDEDDFGYNDERKCYSY